MCKTRDSTDKSIHLVLRSLRLLKYMIWLWTSMNLNYIWGEFSDHKNCNDFISSLLEISDSLLVVLDNINILEKCYFIGVVFFMFVYYKSVQTRYLVLSLLIKHWCIAYFIHITRIGFHKTVDVYMYIGCLPTVML